MHLFHIVWTVTLFVIFIGIILWAFNRDRKSDFDSAAQIPLERDDSDRLHDARRGTSGEGA